MLSASLYTCPVDWVHLIGGLLSLAGKQVLVTGAGGFIGSHLTESLVRSGANTRALIRYNSAGSYGWIDKLSLKSQIEVILGDIRDSDSLGRAMRGVDTVFHLAALNAIPYSYLAPVAYLRTNVEGTLNLLQASLAADVRLVVHTSTSEVYGTARYVPIDEDHPLQGQSPYSASKIGADKIAEAFHSSFGLPVAVIRPFNTFGPRQSARAVIPTIITQALTQAEVRLGNLSPTRDLNYVVDTVDGFLRVADCPKAIGQVINIGSGQEISIHDLATTVLILLGKDLPIVSDDERIRPKASEVERLVANNARAREILGWQQSYTLKEGLTETIEWIERNLESYRVSAYTY